MFWTARAVPLGKRGQRAGFALARAAALVFGVLCLLGGGSREAAAQYTQQGSKLVASDAVGNASQGYSVAVSADGNTMIVGGDTDNDLDGAAWVYTRSGGVWTEQQKLLPSDAVNPAEFGYSVALSADGNTALVGGQGDNGSNGAAWVFTRSGGVWTQQGSKLVGTPGGGQEGFSVALSADGNTAIMGGPGDNGNIGAAWVFTRSGGVWSQQAKLVGTGYVNFMNGGVVQGWSVALSGDGNTAAVGGPADNNVGATWVFTRSGGVWSQQGAKLVGSCGGGYSVALSGGLGNILLVGANAVPTACAFVRNGGVWAQYGSSLTGTGYSGSGFGTPVALSADGNTALLGGYGDNTNVGAAWVFTFNDGAWTQNGSKLVASDETGQGQFGHGVALSADGSTAVIGGPQDNSSTGAAWVFVAAPPTVTALSPAIGTAAGGTSVTITGTNFLGAAAVQFGLANAASFTITNATSITATSPAGGGTVDVTVTNQGGTSATSAADQFTYIGASTPTVTAIAPSSGPAAGGTRVTISGSGFNGASAVQFGATSATSFTLINDSRITATSPPFTPPSSDTVDVTVTVGSLTSVTSAADQFTYGTAPAVTSVAPNSGSAAGGTAVTIGGAGFTGATAVHFGVAAASFTFNSDNSITATSPAGSGTLDVTVTTPSGTSATGAADGFTYIAAPAVTSIAPPSGPAAGGTIVTIGGTDFSGVSAVRFGGTSAIWFNVETATTINAKAPSGLGTVDVTVTTVGGTSATGAADKFVFDPATNRSWVSAAAGSDLNPCSVTLPCRTFSGAYANTLAGGEIDVLSPGDYGPLTVTHAISIYNDGAGFAGALTTAGTSGITVNAGSNDDVNLRGLSFNGFTASGASGVVFNSGAQLRIDKCTFQGFATSGITFAAGAGSAATAAMVVGDTTLIANTVGLSIKPTGGIAANVSLRRIKLEKNTGGGLSIDGTGGSGAINAVLADSSASLNAGNGITATGGPSGVTLNMMRVVAASNGAVGIQSSQSDGGTATVTVGNSTVYGNAVGVQSLDGGALLSYANTQLTGNASDGRFTGSANLQ